MAAPPLALGATMLIGAAIYSVAAIHQPEPDRFYTFDETDIFRSQFFAAMTVICELPATMLLYAVMARLSREMGRAKLAREFLLLALAIVALVGVSMGMFALSQRFHALARQAGNDRGGGGLWCDRDGDRDLGDRVRAPADRRTTCFDHARIPALCGRKDVAPPEMNRGHREVQARVNFPSVKFPAAAAGDAGDRRRRRPGCGESMAFPTRE